LVANDVIKGKNNNNNNNDENILQPQYEKGWIQTWRITLHIVIMIVITIITSISYPLKWSQVKWMFQRIQAEKGGTIKKNSFTSIHNITLNNYDGNCLKIVARYCRLKWIIKHKMCEWMHEKKIHNSIISDLSIKRMEWNGWMEENVI
jgi:hypothetical protein